MSDSTEPALEPPPGQTSNLVDPPSRGYVYVIVAVVSMTVSSLFVIPRIYLTLWVQRRTGLNDFACITAWLGLLALGATLVKLSTIGAFTDQWNVSKATFVEFNRYENYAEIIYSISICLAKLSIVLFYAKLFLPGRGRSSMLYWVIWGLFWFNICFYIANTFAEIWYCIPREAIWQPSVEARCINIWVFIVASGVINAISDLAIVLIPLCIVWKLHMRQRRKLGLSIVFAFALFSLGCGITRAVLSVTDSRDPNSTISITKISCWAVGEVAAGIIASCMPMMPQFMKAIMPKRFGWLSEDTLFEDEEGQENNINRQSVWQRKIMRSRENRRQRLRAILGPTDSYILHSEPGQTLDFVPEKGKGYNVSDASYDPRGVESNPNSNAISVRKTVGVESQNGQNGQSVLEPPVTAKR